MSAHNLGWSALRAVSRARLAILTIAVTYVLSVIVGMLMVHAGNRFALDYTDTLRANANATDPAALALHKGNALSAALLDFSENLLLGAVPNTVTGMAVIMPYPLAAFRGWIGGIVSVETDAAHTSRLANPGEAAYYILTLILQLIPYSLAGGAGVNLGLAAFRPRACYQGARWLSLPVEAIKDVLRIYVLVVPLFLVASLWEFLAR